MMSGATPRRPLDRYFLLLLLIGFYYNAYRYPLQINASGTSPTYSDTPLWLSLGKYFLVALILVYLLFLRVSRRDPIEIRRPLHGAGYVFLALFPVFTGIFVQRIDFVTFGFFFLIPALLHLFAGWKISLGAINRLLAVTIWVALAVEALQVALFLLVGRLPALGFPNSISVRFGSFLDDPNGFGLLLSWMIPFAAVSFRGRRRWAAVGGLLISLILTQSLTSVGVFGVIGLLIVSLYVSTRPRLLFPALAVGVVAVCGLSALAYAYRQEIALLYDLFMTAKLGSLQAHAGALTIFEDLNLLAVLGFEPVVERWEETGYVNLIAYFGVGYLLVYVGLGLSAIGRYIALARNPTCSPETRHFAFGALGLLGAVYLGNLSLPVITIFPLDLIAALLLGISSAGLLPEEDVMSEAAAADEPSRKPALVPAAI